MKRILVALDASPRAPHVLRTAVQLAQRIGAKLDLFRAVTIPPEIPIGRYMNSSGDLGDMLLNEAKTELGETCKNVPPELLEGSHVKIAAPWEGICHTAKDLHADIIVIGSHGYSGLDRVLGTTAARVVNHAECSVLVVR